MRCLVTGSSGLIGSAVAEHFCELGHDVVGIDDGHRAKFFGPEASTTTVGQEMVDRYGDLFEWFKFDIRNAGDLYALMRARKFDAIVHCAGQPSHDWAATDPLTDWSINATATLNLLELARQFCPQAPFVLASTNKVYGDTPNRLPRYESETRFDFSDNGGIDEGCPIDHCMHSLFGCSKLAADSLTQEYGRYYGMPTCCLRLGCITGAAHAGVPQHGFLSYLAKCAVAESEYVVYGYGGKQVRDNLDAYDVAAIVERFIAAPRKAAVYNIGGGPLNTLSILEAVEGIRDIVGKAPRLRFEEQPRKGDHIVYYSDLTRAKTDYPGWAPTKGIYAILTELVEAWERRLPV